MSDVRPPPLNLKFRPGTTITLTITGWTSLAGRTFQAFLGSDALALNTVGDVMTIVADNLITDNYPTAITSFVINESIDGTMEPIIIGRWTPSLDARETGLSTQTLQVTEGAVSLTVQLSSATASAIDSTKVAKAGDTMTGSLVISGATSDLTVGRNATITGKILTGTFGSPATFGGIEREARVFPAGEMVSSTAVMNIGDGFPRLWLPDGETTDVYMIIEIEEWWLDSTIGVYFEWVNDHTTTGNVRFDCSIKECDIGTQTLAAAGTIATRTFTTASPAANISTTSIVCSVANGNPCTFSPGPFASFYVLRISRLGADGADTLAGPIGLVAASMTRGQ